MKLVLASGNAGKLAELAALFAPLGVDWVSQVALGITEADEPHVTFVENALTKARHASRAAGAAAIADDSGLCVDALGGAPGVVSARFAQLAGSDAPAAADPAGRDAANNALLLERMAGVADRRARFVSVLVAVRHADDPEPLVATGRWDGVLLQAPRGAGGFGYDPLLHIAALGRSVAELDLATKNRHSHRAVAAAQMLALMRDGWLRG